MNYTVLRLTVDGVLLCKGHLQRLDAVDGARRASVAAWARSATPGIWALRLDGEILTVHPRAASHLHEQIAGRTHPSPLGAMDMQIAKPPGPSVYDALRTPNVATVLTSPDGTHAWEACTAAVVSCRGGRIQFPPYGHPRVRSVTECAVRDALPVLDAPVQLYVGTPLALLNAVVGVCALRLEGCTDLPKTVRQTLREVIDATIAWP